MANPVNNREKVFQGQITQLEEENVKLKALVLELQTENSKLKAEIVALQNRKPPLKGRKILFGFGPR